MGPHYCAGRSGSRAKQSLEAWSKLSGCQCFSIIHVSGYEKVPGKSGSRLSLFHLCSEALLNEYRTLRIEVRRFLIPQKNLTCRKVCGNRHEMLYPNGMGSTCADTRGRVYPQQYPSLQEADKMNFHELQRSAHVFLSKACHLTVVSELIIRQKCNHKPYIFSTCRDTVP
jgi:hypothetical protein